MNDHKRQDAPPPTSTLDAGDLYIGCLVGNAIAELLGDPLPAPDLPHWPSDEELAASNREASTND